jgi:hypothetical protein
MIYNSPEEYLYNLEVTSSNKALKLWKQSIKEYWGERCAYCNSEENLTIDHIIPQIKGGETIKTNVICACKKCNYQKGYKYWDEWFKSQEFFTIERRNDIIEWMKEDDSKLYTVYPPRKNITNS